MSTRFDLPYPEMGEDQQLRLEQERAERAREALDPSDVLAVVQHIMLEISDDRQNPLWGLVVQAVQVGTRTETGKTPHLAEGVGAAFLPLIDKAITRLVDERLADFNAWGRE